MHSGAPYKGQTLRTVTTHTNKYDGVVCTTTTTLAFLDEQKFHWRKEESQRDPFDGEMDVRTTVADGTYEWTETEVQLTGRARKSLVEYKHCADDDASGCANAHDTDFRMVFAHDALSEWQQL